MIDKTLLDEIIVGRVEPHIYAFTTNTIPNYLKVGDTYRPVAVRLKEWEGHYPNLKKQFEGEAKIGNVYFRDFSVHQFLETEKSRTRLLASDLPMGIHYSREFFKGASVNDIQEAMADIQRDYQYQTQKYQFYSLETLRPELTVFPRVETYDLRQIQKDTVSAFRKAIDSGRKNLLMYAVMRFGKSFTAMCCAVEMKARLVVVVSAKADVLLEWKKTVESHVRFDGYEFVTADNLKKNNHAITERLDSDKKVVIFLTLQDLQGKRIKDKHQEVFGRDIDLLLVDETHFGARAEKYGEVLKSSQNYIADIKNKKDTDDFVEVNEANEIIKALKTKITIHLSGTPYRILMGSEFQKEDIIAFYQFTDIVDEQQAWDKKHILDDDYREWDNPYFGFPQMVRFAFHPNESSRKRLEELRKAGATYAFSALFKPQSIDRSNDGLHKKFVYEQEILDLLEVIDGSKSDDELLGFLDYDKLKEGKMCRHIVVVLPYCASCDALEELIRTNKGKFRNLSDYEIINISGVDNPNTYKKPEDIKKAIKKYEEDGKKTITLTVNRMLTGSTVPEWDTMLYFKDTASPQEYDQAIFRLQNPYVKTFKDETTGKTIKINMKPQTLLVDFNPNRMFVMQEKKAKIYNVNIDVGGNTELERRIRRELEISPIITINKNKIERVIATDIMEKVSNYQKNKGIKDEALEIPVDLSILEDSTIRAVIELENEIGSKSGLAVSAHDSENEDDGSELDIPETPSNDGEDTTLSTDTTPTVIDDKRKQELSLTKKVQSYYTRILLFAFITKDTVISLSDIIAKMEAKDNRRIAKNLGLSKQILTLLNQKTNKFVLSDLDYKIQDLNSLSRATDLAPAERANIAVNKFGKLGDAIVITPSNICDDMINLLPEEFIKSLPTTNGKILDVAGTAGEFAVALYKRMTELGLEKDFVANAIYTIPKSSICYELTRKLYEMLGLNIANIAGEFIATDMLEIEIDDEVGCNKIKALLTQNKPFETIKLTDALIEGEKEMLKFEAVVGNPPYQETTIDTSDNPIYHKFLNIGYAIAEKACFITPAKFLFNAGKTPKHWNRKMLNDEYVSTHYYQKDATKIFLGTDIKGGVVVTYRNKAIKCGAIKFFVENDTIRSILSKVLSEENFESLTSIIHLQNKFNLGKLYEDYPQYKKLIGSKGTEKRLTTRIFDQLDVFTEEQTSNNQLCVLGLINNKRVYRFIDLKYIEENKTIPLYKVVLPEANGTGALGEVLSSPYVAAPNEGFTQSFIGIGAFSNKNSAEAILRYIKTKFARLLLGTLKATHHAHKETWANIPLQDFTKNSDIDWNKTISEIDQQLYKKYNLTEEEISFIESVIKPME